MGKRIKTVYKNNDTGWAEIHMDTKDEHFYIKYFNELGTLIDTEECVNKSLIEVENITNQWILSHK